MKIIYDFEVRTVLENCTGMTQHDIEKAIKKGVQIYTVADYLQVLKDNCVLDDELEVWNMTEEEYAEFLKSGLNSEIDAGTWNGMDYVIEYCL